MNKTLLVQYLRELGYLILPHSVEQYYLKYTPLRNLLNDYNGWLTERDPSTPRLNIPQLKKFLLSGENIVLLHPHKKEVSVNLEIVAIELHMTKKFTDRTYATDIAFSKIEHTKNILAIDEQVRDALRVNAQTQPLSKHEKVTVLSMIQKKFAMVALGELTTEKVNYKMVGGVYREDSKSISTHLPSLDYAIAFSTIGRLIDELEDSADFGDDDDAIMGRYVEWIKNQKEEHRNRKLGVYE